LQRKTTKSVSVGPVMIGGGAPIVVQSMTNSDTRDVGATLAQIHALADAGCEIVRLAVLDEEAASALKEITVDSPLPVIADIHFDYRLAISAVTGDSWLETESRQYRGSLEGPRSCSCS